MYVMHELYHLERTSRKAYQEFRFSQGIVFFADLEINDN